MISSYTFVRTTSGKVESKTFELDQWYEVTAEKFDLIAVDANQFPETEATSQMLVLLCGFVTDDGWDVSGNITFKGASAIADHTKFAIEKMGADAVFQGQAWSHFNGRRVRIKRDIHNKIDFELIPEG